ncbi:Alpha-1,4-glucan:maltose-1-phosphate maltosyltransferase [compost metagenome]
MSSSNRILKQMLRYFADRQPVEAEPIWIPALWNECGYEKVLEESNGEILVEPNGFIARHLQYLYDLSAGYLYTDHTDLDNSVIYCSLLRYSCAWDYHHTGVIQSGTFLRFTFLLPLLKRMGTNILYLLPLTRYSEMYRKGDLGSPYAVYSLFALDEHLHDPLLDGMEHLTLNDELTALVEACHLLDIKVVLDLIPRVIARDNALLEEHPDWMYWIDKEAFADFRPPAIPELDFFTECTPDKLETVYRSGETIGFLQKFRLPPNELQPALWEELKERARVTGEPLLELVESEMGITPAPAHSDWINDVQPIWTDIAFYRLYKDFSPQVRPFLPPDQAPYVLFDTIKCNLYPGEEPNAELWELLIEAARFQLNTYGIDGFRIDIGHVLPVPLLDSMFRTIKEIKPSAILISEDLFNRNHRKAAQTGYNIMLGSGWNIMTDISAENMLGYLKELPELQIHVFACSETADTPRITSRGGKKLSRLMTMFNFFLPNGIPYLTTGMEMFEEQPLNCGLGDNTGGADIPKAFFNNMAINWTAGQTMLPLLEELNRFRKEQAELLKPEYFFIPDPQGDIILYAYYYRNRLLAFCFNLSPDKEQQLNTELILPSSKQTELLINSYPGRGNPRNEDGVYRLQPHQAIALSMTQIYSFREEKHNELSGKYGRLTGSVA